MTQVQQAISVPQQKKNSIPSPHQENEKKTQDFSTLSTLSSIAGLDDIDKQVSLNSSKSTQEQTTLDIEPIPILEQPFQKAYQELIKLFPEKPSILAILQRNDYKIQQNHWIQTVINEVEKSTIELIAEELLAFIKNELQNPSIRLIIHIDPSKASQYASNAPTKQQVILDLINKYPDLQELIKLFDLYPTN